MWNRSNYQVLELRVHDGSTYQGASNLLASPLLCEQRIDVTVTTYQYVTVIRRKNLGENIALTTAEGLAIQRDGYVLVVFNESFRLIDPPSSPDDGPPGGDPGPGDPGAPPGDAVCL